MNSIQLGPTSRLRSERGQMAIFVALIFQVLFVFFAMVVNIGLIVHDKINLQNSVDLAAYYAAQKQAEVLNAIAHQNYQIRQAWKLLSWRIRVLGDLGYSRHPMAFDGPGIASDTSAFGSGQRRSNHLPTICVNHSLWGATQNLCSSSTISIPSLPNVRVVAPFLPWNFLIRMQTNELRDIAGADCQRTGPLNFNIALRWARAYRSQIAQSKEVIRIYADQLSKDTVDFKDVRGNSAKGGALATLKKNLTRANLISLDQGKDEYYRFFNSLGAVGGRQAWLNEVPIYPLIYYVNMTGGGSQACRGEPRLINGQAPDGVQITQDMESARHEPPNVDHLYHSVFGVEKNPWAMAYVGVYAETKPRKPYLPFGEPITLRAKAFAKPFGGRIGPWYYSQWPQGSNKSVGTLEQRIDQLSPIPMDASGQVAASNQAELENGIPNYARYPGDTLGLASTSALTAFRQAVRGRAKVTKLNPAFYSATPLGADGLALAESGNPEFARHNTFLPGLKYSAPWIREIELAAIAPDLFDITYYSVERDSYNNYTDQSIKGKLISEEKIPYDIGSLGKEIRNIDHQIELTSLADRNAFWMVRNPHHLLTAWAPNGAFDYEFPEGVFAKCFDEKMVSQNVPGKCARGGRVGYSVKIVSEDYLNSNSLSLGGEGTKGQIINRPPENF